MSEDERVITVSDRAVSKLREMMAEQNKHGMGVRVAVVRTRCMGGRGFANSLAFESTSAGDDAVQEGKGISLYIDGASARYLRGAELDYVETSAASGFAIHNPNVVSRCPCGRHDIFE